ncbi:thyroid receptor-interacting protein 11-like isoform X3 [Salvelinus alpinus]|uniref:thyroid receptor-interacting protein 11-like isoform X3 n=1 Tax=Salvelinus alpinus TaxID=8036 RepID=UPI0039FD223B
MSSWLGGLGSGLGQSLGQVGGSLSSFTGQISTFTKDMLLEGVEEVEGVSTELQVSSSKMEQVEAEKERLKRVHAELEEKLEASEIQNKQQSAEYRILMQQRDVEISHLKARQTGLQEEVQKLQHSAQSASSGSAVLPVTSDSTTTTRPRGSAVHQGFHGSDEMDFSDVIWSQQEINRLSTEVMRLEAEVSHWRRVSQASEAPGAGNGDQGEVLKLQRIIKELREEMGREVDEHQHELAALQDAQRQKMADVTRRHRDELAEYEERIEELEEQKQTGGNSPASVTHDSSSKASSLHSTSLQEAAEERLKELTASLEEAAEERLKELTASLEEAAEERLKELTASLEEAGRRQATLQREKMEAQAENAELLQNNTQLQSSVTALQTRVQEQEGKAWNKAQLDQEIQGLRNALAGAEREMLRMKTLEREPKSQVERADILELNAIIGTLRKEKVMTEQEKMNLLERLACAEDRVESDVLVRREFSPAASEQIAELRAELEKREQALKDNREERDTLVITLEELDRHNTEATQHVISVKEKLSVQLKESETEVSRLQSELSTTTDQRVALQEELQAQQEKLSQSAYILNDLHMDKQHLEATVKELREKLGRATTMGKETQMLQRTVQEREEQLSAARAELCEAGERGRESGGSREELEDLRRELAEMRSSQEKVMSDDYEMKMEKQRLKTEAEHAQGTIEELARQVREVQDALNRTVLEKDTRIEALKLEKSQLEGELGQAERGLQEQARQYQQTTEALKLEKSQLEGELGQAERGLQEQVRQYQQTIEELTAARSMDASALQTAHERTVKLNQEKDLKISQLRRDVEQMASEHRGTDEMLSVTVAEEKKQLIDLLQEKDSFTESLRANMDATQRELESVVQAATQEAETLRGALQEKDSFTESLRANMAATQRELESVRGALEEKDTQLGGMKEDNSHLKEEMERLTDQLSRPQPPGLAEPRTPDIITELENEITQLKTSGDASRRTVEEQQGHLLSSQQSLLAQQNELEQAHQRHEQSRENYDRLIHAKDEEIRRLQQEVDHLGPTRYSQEQEVVILQREDETKSSLNNGDNGNEKHDLSKVEVESLVKGIKEKETEISQLNEKNQNLTRQLDQLVVSREEMGKLSQMVQQKDVEIQALHSHVSLGGGGHSRDVLSLQQQLQAYAVEREQVLAVLNEKTRENSQLRGDYQHIMDIVAGKEAVLLKVQQENTRLSTMSDPSGSREMFRETIQNLSRIIREKDIEIDALTQKCQTLVSVLQAGDSGGVSSNQFEELLQERDTLKQQVKKMEEWKMQVITTVKNMQHESGQLVEELHKLQGQVDADKDCTSDLSVDYSRLIHSYEQKERKLGSLSHELAHVQQTISQLSSTKDVLLGKLDSVAQSPQVTPLSAALTSSAQPPAAVKPPRHQVAAPATPGNQEGLRQELVSLRALLSERETMIRTLQENNHRLSNSAQVSDSEQRGQADEARQVRERLDALQRSVREKDLLIKTKGDQLNQVSENLRNRESDNELLKQAVTNLKERALILEMDTRKLKDENEAVAQRSREKESEFRALQETNMQVSLLMREKEFERSVVSEKAAAMEKMLKDREQGNSQRSGELNQLLNELRSMQEKAVAFQQERDQVMLALKQKQMETTAVQTELQHVKDREQRLKLELDRLRNHLLEIEDTYTREALAAEDREAELRRRVTLLDDRLATSSSQVESTSHQASLQVESLQEQLSGTVRQRDEALTQLRAARDQVNQYAVSLSNLQVVIEQFQQEEKAMYSSELDKYKREKDEWRRKAVNLEDRASALQINLDEANAALDSATRLTDQLDLMEEQLEELKKQVDVRQEMLEEAQDKLMTLLNSTEGKVDQALMRNLFTGYFHTPKPKRSEVLRLMGSVLGLDKDEVNQMLEEDGGRGGWVSSWLGGRTVQSGPNTPQRPGAGQGGFNNSFSEMFVKFLEVESSPVVPAPRLPVYDINPLSAPPPGRTTSSAWAQQPEGGAAAGRGQRAAGESNPFLAPRSAVVPLMHHGSGSSSGSGGHHLLMKPISDNLPTFTPVPVSPESGGQVLKDLLKQ